MAVIESFETAPPNSDLTWTDVSDGTLSRTTNNVTQGTYSWECAYSGAVNLENPGPLQIFASVDLTSNAGDTLSLDYTVNELGNPGSPALILGCSDGAFNLLEFSQVNNPTSGTISLTIPASTAVVLIAYVATVESGSYNVTINIDNLLTEAAASNVTITVPASSFTFTGYAPTVSSGASVTVPLSEFVFTSYAPVIETSTLVSVPLSTFTFTGYSPEISTGASVSVPLSGWIFTSYAPQIITSETARVISNQGFFRMSAGFL